MAGTLKWPIDDAFKAMVNQATANKTPILFVKDQGVYLMSSGKDPKDNKVVYAKGFNPEVDSFDDWYDKAHAICGGDDFGEQLKRPFFERAITQQGTLEIYLSATHMNMKVRG